MGRHATSTMRCSHCEVPIDTVPCYSVAVSGNCVTTVPRLLRPIATPSRCYAHYGTMYSIIDVGPTPYPCTPLVDMVFAHGGAANTQPATRGRTPISMMVFVLQGGPTPRTLTPLLTNRWYMLISSDHFSMSLFGYMSQVDNFVGPYLQPYRATR